MAHSNEIRLRWSELKYEIAARRLRRLLRKYNPNQPRVPTGNPRGGEWTRGGGGGGASTGGDLFGGSIDGIGDLLSVDGETNLDAYWPSESGISVDDGGDPSIPVDPIADNGYTLGTNDRVREPFIAPDGSQVLNRDSQPMMQASEFPPEFFVKKGEEAGRDIRDLMRLEQPGAAFSRLAQDLYRFRQGGEWDMQRSSGIFDGALTDYSTVAIGLYAAAAGLTESQILSIQNTYAWLFSRFRPPYDPTYGSLGVFNIWNTRLGFSLYEKFYRWRWR